MRDKGLADGRGQTESQRYAEHSEDHQESVHKKHHIGAVGGDVVRRVSMLHDTQHRPADAVPRVLSLQRDQQSFLRVDHRGTIHGHNIRGDRLHGGGHLHRHPGASHVRPARESAPRADESARFFASGVSGEVEKYREKARVYQQVRSAKILYEIKKLQEK